MQFSFHMLWLLFSHTVYWFQNFTFCLKSSLFSSNPVNRFLLCSPMMTLVSLLWHLRYSMLHYSHGHLYNAFFTQILLNTCSIELRLIDSLTKTGSKYGWGKLTSKQLVTRPAPRQKWRGLWIFLKASPNQTQCFILPRWENKLPTEENWKQEQDRP